MKRILVLLLAALIFSSCSVPKTGKGNKTESSADSQASVIGIKDNNGQTVPINETVIYDRCGVKVTSPGLNGGSPMLQVSNGSQQTVSLESVYMSADGSMMSNLDISSDPIPAGGKTNITLGNLSGVCSLKTRFCLKDEDYRFVEDSLSEPIELTISNKLYLPAKELYSLVYEDEKLLLGLCGVTYRENSNRVTMKLYLKNKTDQDLWISAEDVECDHKDYYSYLSCLIPAKTEGNFNTTASTRNATLSPADLDSISFSLVLKPVISFYTYSQDNEIASTERFTLKLPKAGRPETVIPDTIESTISPEEYIAEVVESDELTPLDKPGLLYEDENILAELVLAARGTKTNGKEYCSLHFRVQNKLKKQIMLSPYGMLNGATMPFNCSDSVKPMTEQYVEVTSAIDDESILGSFTDAVMRFDYSYDDGSYDDSSYIGSTDPFTVVCADKLSRPGVPENAKAVYSDDNCDLYLLGSEKDEDYNSIDLRFYAVNKADKMIEVTASAADGSMIIYKNLAMLRGSYTVGSLRAVTFDSEKELSTEMTDGLKVIVYVSDIEGNRLSEGEGTL